MKIDVQLLARAPQRAPQLVEVHAHADGRPALLRPLLVEDAPLLQAFVRQLSPEARRRRFQTGINELYPALLAQLMQVDRHGHAACVAIAHEQGRKVMVGEARYAPSVEDRGASEFAIAVADRWQHGGLGSALIRRLLRHAVHAGVARLHGDILQENTGMLRLAKKLGFRLVPHPDGAWLARVTMDLRAPVGAVSQPATATFVRRDAAGSSSAAIKA